MSGGVWLQLKHNAKDIWDKFGVFLGTFSLYHFIFHVWFVIQDFKFIHQKGDALQRDMFQRMWLSD